MSKQNRQSLLLRKNLLMFLATCLTWPTVFRLTSKKPFVKKSSSIRTESGNSSTEHLHHMRRNLCGNTGLYTNWCSCSCSRSRSPPVEETEEQAPLQLQLQHLVHSPTNQEQVQKACLST